MSCVGETVRGIPCGIKGVEKHADGKEYCYRHMPRKSLVDDEINNFVEMSYSDVPSESAIESSSESSVLVVTNKVAPIVPKPRAVKTATQNVASVTRKRQRPAATASDKKVVKRQRIASTVTPMPVPQPIIQEAQKPIVIQFGDFELTIAHKK
jgi:hypothetical protein